MGLEGSVGKVGRVQGAGKKHGAGEEGCRGLVDGCAWGRCEGSDLLHEISEVRGAWPENSVHG